MLSFSPSPDILGIDPERPPKDRYRILGQIAAGGMAEIYLAHMDVGEEQPREVVLKRLRPELQLEEEFVQMFYDEARIVSVMDHPNIARIYELGELDGSLFISMEPVFGVSLRDAVARLTHRNTPMPYGLVLRIAAGSLAALDYAHNRKDSAGRPLSIVHRDVSPQNILMSYDGDIKLLDFGVAKSDRKFHKTLPGLIKGKFGYMAPEQVRGEQVDGRADIFALGETLYEAAAGVHPFPGSSDAAILSGIMNKTPRNPADVCAGLPASLAAIFMRALEKEPAQRYANADEMRSELMSRFADEIATADALSSFLSELFVDAHALFVEARKADDRRMLVRALRTQDFIEASQPPPRPRYYEVPTEELPRMLSPPRPDASGESTPTPDLPDSGDLIGHSTPLGIAAPRRIRSTSGVQVPPTLTPAPAPVPKRSIDATLRRLREGPTTGELDLTEPDDRARTPQPATTGRKAGATRIGRYTISRFWKNAGITESFLARQDMPFGLERRVVLERILPEHAQAQAAIEALANKARILLRLDHPNIVQILDFGAHRGEPYLVLEWIDGWTLTEVFAACRSARRPIPTAFVCRIASDLAAALSAMHPFVHGALTPERVWVSRKGAVKITDFGTAKELDDLSSPEEHEDLEAAGRIILEAATLEHPQEVRTTLEGPTVHPEMKPLLLRVLGGEEQDRYSNAHALQLDIEQLLIRIGQTATALELASWLDQLFSQ